MVFFSTYIFITVEKIFRRPISINTPILAIIALLPDFGTVSDMSADPRIRFLVIIF